MRKQIVAGNWKMNNDYVDSELFVSKLLKELKHTTTEVIIAPPFYESFGIFKLRKRESSYCSCSKHAFCRKWRLYRRDQCWNA